MNWTNEVTEMLRVKYPIIQAPMLGVTTPAMVAAISNSGALGSLPVGGLSPEKCREFIRKTKDLTTHPFAVNLFADEPPEKNDEVKEMRDFLEKVSNENKIRYQDELISNFRYYSYKEQLEVILSEQIAVVSFTFGIPDDASLRALKENCATLIGTATCTQEAMLLEEKGIDIITAQGIEAGGHRGSFVKGQPLPAIGSMALIPQIVKKVSKPVLAAGGINNGSTIKAAIQLGAKGVQIGTAFIASDESGVSIQHKQAVLNATATDLVLTRAMTGRWARGLNNTLIKEIEGSGIDILPYPVQLSLTLPIRAFAQQQDNTEFISMWAGQALSPLKEVLPAASILKQMVEESEHLD